MIKLFLRNVKKGFATNSSSYHSTLIMTKEEYDKWEKKEIEIDNYTYEEWYESDYAEYDETNYTTPSGDKIIVLCMYGSDY